MYTQITLLIYLILGVALSFTRRDLLSAYGRAFAPRHGTAFQVGVTTLATLTLATLVVTLLRPGEAPLVEQVNAAIAFAGSVLGGWDLRTFAASLKR